MRQFGLLETSRRIRPLTDVGDLWNLYNLIRGLRPRQVVEYGSGASTFIILYALEENSKGGLHSVERDQLYGSEVLGLIPTNLKERLRSDHNWAADFIYIDDENPDILPTLTSIKRGVKILIDGREMQTREIINFLRERRELSIKTTLFYHNTILELV